MAANEYGVERESPQMPSSGYLGKQRRPTVTPEVAGFEFRRSRKKYPANRALLLSAQAQTTAGFPGDHTHPAREIGREQGAEVAADTRHSHAATTV
jgi:hypothetical protein